VVRKIFGPKDETNEQFRMLHNKEHGEILGFRTLSIVRIFLNTKEKTHGTWRFKYWDSKSRELPMWLRREETQTNCGTEKLLKKSTEKSGRMKLGESV
jgi:hypothetical protein